MSAQTDGTQMKPDRRKTLQSVNESGGLFAIWNHPNAHQITYFGLHALQHRGQTSVGLVSYDDGEFHGLHGNGLLTQVFNRPEKLERLIGRHAIGQVRSATQADREDNTNIQPLVFHFSNQTMVITHNGNITNGLTLREQLEAEGAVLSSNSAAELLIHLMRRKPAEDFEAAFKASLRELRGGFNFCLLTESGLYGAVDRNSFRPLVLGQMANGSYLLASETCALHTIGAKFVTEIFAGQYVVINDEGYRIGVYVEDMQITIEPMEYIYFARPDSDIAGVNVHSARKEMGRRLALEQPAPTADLVIGVPNSSLSAASGYAEASGLPYEIGLIKHQYVGRTFIQPTQELREQGVRSKLSVVVNLVRDKSVVLVDDSIVRGTTIRRLAQLLKESGAREIHLRIASPPLRFPNFYGIDVSHTSEMIAANYTVKELNELFGSDSLGYLSVQGLIDSVGLPIESETGGLSLDAFTGAYPADIADCRESLEASLTPLQEKIRKGASCDE